MARWVNPNPANDVSLEDMEYRSELSVLRHYIENRLAAFTLAVSTNDPTALKSLLQSVGVSLIGPSLKARPLEALDIINYLSPWNRRSLLTTSNLTVQCSGVSLRYAAVYQLWPTAPATNIGAISFGMFRGTIDRLRGTVCRDQFIGPALPVFIRFHDRHSRCFPENGNDELAKLVGLEDLKQHIPADIRRKAVSKIRADKARQGTHRHDAGELAVHEQMRHHVSDVQV